MSEALWQIEVAVRPEHADSAADEARRALADLGLTGVSAARCVKVYLVEGLPTRADAERVASQLLADPVVERWSLETLVPAGFAGAPTFTVRRRAGVMDPARASIEQALGDLGYAGARVGRATRYHLAATDAGAALSARAARALSNAAIEEVAEGAPRLALPKPGAPAKTVVRTIAVRGADDSTLETLSRARGLALSAVEMRAVAAHYAGLGRDPTDVELGTIAQTWSEHCCHKTLTHPIQYGARRFENLLAETIKAATVELARPWCVSVFVDNAGIVEFSPGWCVCFKVETHNHPSAIEPYGGAGTGLGGVIRDVLGTGLGARPILATDVFCFAPPNLPERDLPPGSLAPLRVMRGVVAGVRDYGNRMGIPTLSGALYFDPGYAGNPLVYAGCVGILPRDACAKAPCAGDLVVVVGGRTGRDGIGGATFSSEELTDQSETVSSGAVQIGNPIEEKMLLEAIIALRDERLYTAITDCGAGGLSSAVGEMGSELGAVVELEKVPLKYDGLRYDEIWLSESQERMVIAVPPAHLGRVVSMCAAEGVEATAIGRFTGDGPLVLRHGGLVVGELDMAFLHDGIPRTARAATPTNRARPAPTVPAPDIAATLRGLLAHPDVASKAFVVRQYDHEVQGTSAIKPFVGVGAEGPSDGTAIRPLPDVETLLAVSCGACPRWGRLDPRRMALGAIDEAIRNLVATGARPDRIALLDNFSWGNTKDPEQLGALVETALACKDAALAYGAPFISGKDSLNNEMRAGERRWIIPPTLLVSALGVIDRAAHATTSDAKRAGNALVLVGQTTGALGGSLYHELAGVLGGEVPAVDLALAPRIVRALHQAITAGHIAACHDPSEGGLAVAIAEMLIGGRLGARVDIAPLGNVPGGPAAALFAESPSRFVLEVETGQLPAVRAIFAGLPFAELGELTAAPVLTLHAGTRELARLELSALRASFLTLDHAYGPSLEGAR